MRSLSDAEAAPYLDGTKRAYVMVAGRHQFFPQRELETLRYSIEATYTGLYQTLRSYLGKPRGDRTKPKPGQELTYARYGLWHYVRKDKQRVKPYQDIQRAGFNLRGIIRTTLFKRLESSVEAFRKSLKRMIKTHAAFLKALEGGFVPAGESAETLLGKSGIMDEDDLLEALSEVSGKYPLGDFEASLLKEHIEADIALLKTMLGRVKPITAANDDKLQTLLRRLENPPLKGRKCLIFTQYADTAIYLHDNLNPGDRRRDIEVIYGTDKSKSRVVGRFAPKANPDFAPSKPEDEIRLLVATDVLAEGLNMQDCSNVLNYDLHWNPVRLIQRFGRIDRIGSEHQSILGLNFMPEAGIERNLGLKAVLAERIREIHETIGEDAAILDKSEQLNEAAMYAIYEGNKVAEVDDKEEEFMDLNEAEEFFRTLAKEDPNEYHRICSLRDGIRASRARNSRSVYVFCQSGWFNQLFLASDEGAPLTRDLPRVLQVLRATPDTPSVAQLPEDFNRRVMQIKHLFVEEMKHRLAQRDHAVSLRPAQRYVLRELQVLFAQIEDEDIKTQINILENAFRISPTAAVTRELNALRRNGVVGDHLLRTLTNIYHQHRIRDRLDQGSVKLDKDDIPRVICSESL